MAPPKPVAAAKPAAPPAGGVKKAKVGKPRNYDLGNGIVRFSKSKMFHKTVSLIKFINIYTRSFSQARGWSELGSIRPHGHLAFSLGPDRILGRLAHSCLKPLSKPFTTCEEEMQLVLFAYVPTSMGHLRIMWF